MTQPTEKEFEVNQSINLITSYKYTKTSINTNIIKNKRATPPHQGKIIRLRSDIIRV